MDQQAQQQQAWQQQARQQQPVTDNSFKNVFAVYSYLLLGILVTVLTVMFCYQLQIVVSSVRYHFVITMVIITLLMTFNLSMFNAIHYPERKSYKLVFWIINCILAGFPLLEADSEVLIKSAFYTTILVVILSLKSFLIPIKIINSLIYPMTALHTVVLISTLYSILFGLVDTTFSRIVAAFCLHGGFLVYSVLLICNTQRLCLSAKYPRFDPMFSAVVMFMNIINLYSRMATFYSIETAIKC